MNRYESYKETPYQWIGKIPNHWQTQRVKFVCNDIFPGATPSTAKKEYWDGNIPWIPSGCCHDCDVVEAPKYITDLGLQNSSTRLIPANTTIIALTGATCSQLGYLKIEACANQSVIAFVENEKKTNSRFLFYALRSARSNILTNQTGGAQAGINMEDCKNIILVFPPLEEQKAIADFLDAKTAELDEESQNLLKQIEILKELRKSVINKAITIGLDANVAMKRTDKEIISEIPKSWQLKKIKYICDIFGRIGYRGYTNNDIVPEGEGAITLSPSNMDGGKMAYYKLTYLSWNKYYESPEIQIFNGDVLMVKTGSSYGKCSYVEDLPMESTINPQIIVFKNFRENSKFFSYCLQTYIAKFHVESSVVGGTIPTISQEKINNYYFPVPPINEQKAIADYLDKKTAEIDEQIHLQEQQIKLIDELKQSIISQAVTGKIKVF